MLAPSMHADLSCVETTPTFTNALLRTYACTCILACYVDTYTHTHLYTHTNTLPHSRTHTHTLTHTSTYTCTHTYTHSHTYSIEDMESLFSQSAPKSNTQSIVHKLGRKRITLESPDGAREGEGDTETGEKGEKEKAKEVRLSVRVRVYEPARLRICATACEYTYT